MKFINSLNKSRFSDHPLFFGKILHITVHKKQHWWFIFFAPHHLKEDAESKHNLPLAAVDEITSLFGNRTTHRVLHTYYYLGIFNEIGEITIKQTAKRPRLPCCSE